MTQAIGPFVAGIDVGTECVKAIVMAPDKEIRGRSVVPSRGYFQDCVQEAFTAALDEAQVERGQLAQICATGFAARCVPDATLTYSESGSHAWAASHFYPGPKTVADIGGRDPNVVQIDEKGNRSESRSVRKCAVGIGTFLMFAARHLDVHPTRLEELAASAERPAVIGSYCSVFASSEILDRLLDGFSPEEIALGCIRSVAERVYEIGDFRPPLIITGGVAEYFPGVLKALAELTGVVPQTVPEPITAGAVGAALKALEKARAAGVDPIRTR
jgi:predicted CoA-substrate-specific enzyme activase